MQEITELITAKAMAAVDGFLSAAGDVVEFKKTTGAFGKRVPTGLKNKIVVRAHAPNVPAWRSVSRRFKYHGMNYFENRKEWLVTFYIVMQKMSTVTSIFDDIDYETIRAISDEKFTHAINEAFVIVALRKVMAKSRKKLQKILYQAKKHEENRHAEAKKHPRIL